MCTIETKAAAQKIVDYLFDKGFGLSMNDYRMFCSAIENAQSDSQARMEDNIRAWLTSYGLIMCEDSPLGRTAKDVVKGFFHDTPVEAKRLIM